MGDLAELMASVAEKGIIEPLIVRQRGARYQIIAGERRYHAAVQVGLRDVPVIAPRSRGGEVMELALVWPGSWASRARRSPNRCDWQTCPTKCGTYVGWPTPTKSFDLRPSFKKSRAEKDAIISALENIIKELRAAR